MANQADEKDFAVFGVSPIRNHSDTDSSDHNETDSCPPVKQNTLTRPFPTDNGGSYTAVKVSHKYSNGLEVEETARTGKRLRIQKFSDDGTPIQYYSSGFYLRLNDCDDPEAYKLEMNKFLPDEDDPSRKKYLFKWTPTSTPQAGLLTVLTYYVALDTSTSPPKNLKIVTKPDDNGAAFIHRYELPEDFIMLFFNYNDKYYQIKVENGVPAVEERKSQDDLDKAYVWKASL